jgi:RNA polymerase sigma-70 factor (ECF subfamily)
MASTLSMTAGNNSRQFVIGRVTESLTDSELLERFVSRRDEPAFEALLHSHGPMVLGVCRRTLRREADAEDAFQATFLVLVRKAASIRPRNMVGNWLYGVAHSTALKARAMSTKRSRKEQLAAALAKPHVVAPTWQDLKPVLDRELNALPDKYRAPIVLCDIEGRSLKDVAQQLGCPVGTVGTRVARGRVMLARRLTRHGIVPSAALLALLLSQNAATACVPGSLATSTVSAAIGLMAGSGTTGCAISARVAALMAAVLRSLLVARLRIAVIALLFASAIAVAGSVLTSDGKIGSWSPFSKTDKFDSELIHDTWFVAAAFRAGEPVPFAKHTSYGDWTFDSERGTVQSTVCGAGAFQLDSAATPKEIDIAMPNAPIPVDLPPLTGAGIYVLHGVSLTISVADSRVPTAARPLDFESKPGDHSSTVFILQRKPATGKCAPH